MTAAEKLKEASSFDILGGMVGCYRFIKICNNELIERDIDPVFIEAFNKHILNSWDTYGKD